MVNDKTDDDRPEEKYIPLEERNSMNRAIDDAEGVFVLPTEKDEAQGGDPREAETD